MSREVTPHYLIVSLCVIASCCACHWNNAQHIR